MDPTLTDRANRALDAARDEALRLRHEYLGTEHILLGLAHEADGIVAEALRSFGADLDRIRREVIGIISIGPEGGSPDARGWSPRGRRTLQFARDEAARVGRPRADAEDLLVGIAREAGGVAAQILHGFGTAPEEVRAAVDRLRGR